MVEKSFSQIEVEGIDYVAKLDAILKRVNRMERDYEESFEASNIEREATLKLLQPILAALSDEALEILTFPKLLMVDDKLDFRSDEKRYENEEWFPIVACLIETRKRNNFHYLAKEAFKWRKKMREISKT